MSWCVIDLDESGNDVYDGGVVLRDEAGGILRVSLGENDVDCRPYYVASPDDWIVKALVASEDGSFWTHHGVRPLSMLRAFAQNVFYRRRISGASTITMQAVRLVRPHRKSYLAKWAEAVRALKLERRHDKTWIVSQYLNRAPFGSNFVGIEAAANGWFGKGAKDLGLGEAAMLAGMVQAPSRFRPDRGYDKAFKRRDYVLGRMLKLGMITAEQAEGAKSVRPVVCRAPRPFKAPYFCDWVMQTLGKDRAGQRASGDFVTTLSPDVQAVCEHAVASAAEAGGYSVAAVVMKVDDGEVKALACSGDYFDRESGQVNTALAPRPAGSTLKPFLAALAMDRGEVTPEERLKDVPIALSGYRPANFDAKYRGLVTLRDSLVLSLNIPFVRLLGEVGVERFGDTLRGLGFAHLGVSDRDAGLGMAIGNVEVTLVELVAAYGALARGGFARRPVGVKGTRTGADGRVFSPAAGYLVSDMLSGGERSTAALGHVADVALPRFAWKTGTSSAYRDAWTVVWNPEYVVGVWCGHMSGGFGDRTLVGAKAAAPVAWGIARALYPQNDGPWFVEPGDVVTRTVCRLTGLPANPDCPETCEGRAIRDRSSALLCPVHRRDAAGRPETMLDPQLKAFAGEADSGALTISRPENGAVFRLVGGELQQKVVCQVIGSAAGERLWWFVDGSPAGESAGGEAFLVDMTEGAHTIVCTTAAGAVSEVKITVKYSVSQNRLRGFD